jgi:YegS/Rv2252/BmrU family lipid kinase
MWPRSRHIPASVTTFLLVNPAAGRGRAARLAEAAASACRSAWGPVERRDTTAPGVAPNLVQDAVEAGAERVIVLGGDGSLHEAANGLLAAKVDRRPPISVIPAGTGNDFAKLVGTVGLDPSKAVERLAAGRLRHLDVGEAWGEYFLNSVGIGFDAAVASEVRQATWLTGLPAYLVAVGSVLRHFKARRLSVTADGIRFEEPLLLIEIGVGPIVGGGFRLTPDAKPDDGVFDVCAIREQSTIGILTKVPLAIIGRHTRLDGVRCFRTTELTVRGEEEGLSAQFDGELRSGAETMQLRIVPLALPVLVCQ